MIHGTDGMDRPIATPGAIRRLAPYALAAAAALLVLALFAAPALRRWSAADRTVPASRLRVATVERGDLVRDLEVQGRVVAANHPRLYSPAAGTVHLAVRPGETVARGQLLATVASPELESELAQERARLASLDSEASRARIAGRQRSAAAEQESALAEVRLAAAERELARATRLRDEGLVDQGAFERAGDAVAVARLERDQRRENLRLDAEAVGFEIADRERQAEGQRLRVAELERRVAALRVVAPFDGQVAAVAVQDRDQVPADAPLVDVVDLSAFEVEVGIPEAYAGEVAIGAPAAVSLLGREYPAKVTRVAPAVSGAEVAATVVFTGPPPEGLRQSQQVSTRLVFETRRGVLKVARGPFLESGGGRQAYVLADGLARLRPIRTGATSVGEVEILDGLREGDRILLGDLRDLEGAKTVLVSD